MKLKMPKTEGKRGRGSQGAQKAPHGLSEADQKFIAHYLKTGNATESYHKAGFNGNNPGPNGYKMLHKANIQDFLAKVGDRAVAKAASKLEITVDKVLQDIEEARLIALEALPSPQCAAAIKASELHGRHIGMFREDYNDREQAPMVVIRVQGEAQVAVLGREQSTWMAPALPFTPSHGTEWVPVEEIHTEEQHWDKRLRTHLPSDVDEVLTSDDIIYGS